VQRQAFTACICALVAAVAVAAAGAATASRERQWRTRGLALLSPAQRLRCSAFWGHNGDWPGYHADAFATTDLTRQVVLLVNGDVEGHPGPRFAPLAQLAYCG
jgi:S-formylglutathione hydrolase FrmB